MSLGLIWAQSTAGVIGRDGGLPWHLPEDLARFRAVTTGHPVIMGRRTWEALPARFRPLPGRRNIVVSRRSDLRLDDAEVTGSLPAAAALIAGTDGWVIGGAQVYAAALSLASLVDVTEIDIDVDGDTYAPDLTGWALASRGPWHTSSTGLNYRFLRYAPDGTAQHVNTG